LSLICDKLIIIYLYNRYLNHAYFTLNADIIINEIYVFYCNKTHNKGRQKCILNLTENEWYQRMFSQTFKPYYSLEY